MGDLICNCKEWKEGMEQIITAQRFYFTRTGKDYTGKFFIFCPWCAQKLWNEDKWCDAHDGPWGGEGSEKCTVCYNRTDK